MLYFYIFVAVVMMFVWAEISRLVSEQESMQVRMENQMEARLARARAETAEVLAENASLTADYNSVHATCHKNALSADVANRSYDLMCAVAAKAKAEAAKAKAEAAKAKAEAAKAEAAKAAKPTRRGTRELRSLL